MIPIINTCSPVRCRLSAKKYYDKMWVDYKNDITFKKAPLPSQKHIERERERGGGGAKPHFTLGCRTEELIHFMFILKSISIY